jgi:hypothetical protein
MIRFKEIRLFPTEFTLDVYVVDDASILSDMFEERYGADESFILTLKTNECLSFETDLYSDLKGDRVFVLILDNLKPYIVAHELVHLLWQLSETIGVEMNPDSQEWQALFIEHLTSEILKDNYHEIN